MRWARHDYERGAALLVVLWTTVLIAGLATIVSGTVRTDLTVTRYQVLEAQARHRAHARAAQRTNTRLCARRTNACVHAKKKMHARTHDGAHALLLRQGFRVGHVSRSERS